MHQVRGILLALGLTGKLVVVLNQALDAPGADGAVWMHVFSLVQTHVFSLLPLCLEPGA